MKPYSFVNGAIVGGSAGAAGKFRDFIFPKTDLIGRGCWNIV
ncbi:MAG: hypothetical protein ABL904_19000 [Hyphomicrobiaceae bacterium]